MRIVPVSVLVAVATGVAGAAAIALTSAPPAASVPEHGGVMLRAAGDPRRAVHPGGSLTVTTTATNSGRQPAVLLSNGLAAPDGWNVEATSRETSVLVGANRAFATTWTVRAPADAKPGSYELTSTATYQPDDTTAQTTVQVDVTGAAGHLTHHAVRSSRPFRLNPRGA